MEERKIFNGKEIKIRTFSERDLKLAKEFLDFYNSLIEEEVQITSCKKKNLKEEKEWLRKELDKIKKKKKVVIVAEIQGKIIAYCGIELLSERRSHVGELGITIKKDYRGLGLGSYLMKKILVLAKEKLDPKSIRATVFPTNKIAISLYKKFGFRIVAKIPKQISYKGKILDEIIMLKNYK